MESVPYQANTPPVDSALEAWIADSKNAFYDPVLEGVVINALGDSYFRGSKLGVDGVWLTLLAKKYGIQMHNYGINGSTVADVAEKKPMVRRYGEMPDNNPHMVFVEGGRNDFKMRVPVGTADSRDISTYCGALNVILEGVKHKYPNALIICFTPWNFPEVAGYERTSKDYADAMETVARAWGASIIRADDPKVSGIDMRDADFRARYCLTPGDISHLNLEGMKIAMTHFEKILAAYFREYRN